MKYSIAKMIILIVVFGDITLARISLAADYYVDYEAGSDSSNGLTISSAWKHAPGDSAATGVPASIILSEGSVIKFKGGVPYYGSISVNRNGTTQNPIVYKGDGWGSQKSVLDGSQPYQPVWTRCSSASACGGNPAYSNIYFASAPAGYDDFRTAIYENNSLLWYSQSPNPSDPIYYDDIYEYFEVPNPSSTIDQTQTSVTDPRVFIQSDPSFWSGAFIIAWVNGNVVDIKKITSFDPVTDTVFHEALSNTPYTDRTGRYAILNHLSLIDRPGEYFHDSANSKIYLWPKNSLSPANNQYSIYSKDNAISFDGRQNLIIEGFEIMKYTTALRSNWSATSNVIVKNNNIHDLKSGNSYAIEVNGNSTIEGNRIVDAQRAVGILGSGTGIVVKNNHIERTTRLGIWFTGASNARMENNVVTDIAGSHANGISIYSGSDNVFIAGNKVSGAGSAITYEASSNLTFINNVVSSGQISDWFGMTGMVFFYNNTFPNSSFYISSNPSYVFKNNVLGAGVPGTRSYNIYTTSGISFQTGEFAVTNLNNIFMDPENNDFRLKAGSLAIDAGTAVSVTNDITGISRPQGAGYDIGAYEYVEGGSDPTPPASPAGLVVR